MRRQPFVCDNLVMLRTWTWAILLVAPAAACTLSRAGTHEEPNGAGGAGTGATGTGGSLFGGSGGSTTSSSGATGGTGGGPQEDCLNGLDDDANGSVDCADPACAPDFECVPAALSAEAYVVDGGSGCGPGLAESTYWGCEACSCSETDGTCGLQVTLNDHGACNGANGTPQTVPAAGNCLTISQFSDQGSFKVGVVATSSLATTANCDPGTATEMGAAHGLCEAPVLGGGCGATAACVPAAATPWCVIVDGAQACPAGYTPTQRLFAGATAPTCTCSCSAGAQVCGSGQVHVGDNNSCTGGTTIDLPADGTCQNSNLGSVRSLQVTNPIAATTTCTASATAPQPKRLCCP